MGEFYIPQKTMEELNATHPPGTRHEAIIKIAMSLLGNGLTEDAVFAQIRASFDDEKTDKEIRDVIVWCKGRNPEPSRGSKPNGFRAARPASMPQRPRPPKEVAKEFINGTRVSVDDWREKSPIQLEDISKDAENLLMALYKPRDHINLVTKFTMREDKANPQGGGKTLPRDEWVKWFREKGVPHSDAGAWIRPNPCKPVGSGKDGAITDADITSFRFVMVESDNLSIEEQLTIYSKIRLPIAAVIYTGGGSVHAWFKVDCESEEDYESVCARIYAVLCPMGFDKANKNPSRLSRLPGVPRKIGGTSEQQLYYLNPNPDPLDVEAFEAAAAVVHNLLRGDELQSRVVEYMRPKPFPFTLDFMRGKNPNEGFYFRDDEVTIWSGMSGHGKSTMLFMVMGELIVREMPFFVASLEYRPEKLCELITFLVKRRQPTSDEVVTFCKVCGPMFSVADEVGEIEPKALFQMMRAAHARFGARHFFIDSLMRVSGLEENYPAQGQFVNELQAIAKSTNGHVHLVAHPRKILEEERARKMDVKGSSLLVNNADNVVMMKRNSVKKKLFENGELTAEKDEELYDAEFAVEKQRATGWEGVMKLRFDKEAKLFMPFTPKVPAKRLTSYPPKALRNDDTHEYL